MGWVSRSGTGNFYFSLGKETLEQRFVGRKDCWFFIYTQFLEKIVRREKQWTYFLCNFKFSSLFFLLLLIIFVLLKH